MTKKCRGIERNQWLFNHDYSEDDKLVLSCYVGWSCPNAMKFLGTPEENFNAYFKMRQLIMDEEAMIEAHGESHRVLTKCCPDCLDYEPFERQQKSDARISIVNLGILNNCNSNCIYCVIPEDMQGRKFDHSQWDSLISTLEYGCNMNYIHPDCQWVIAAGEITIHPFRDRIYEMTKDKEVLFFTNCFIYDPKISEILLSNPRSGVNLSIDSGTRETWHKVKGHDNFDKVISNWERYISMTTRRDFQLPTKYVILPGINDNDEDFRGFLELITRNGLTFISISRDKWMIKKVKEYDDKLMDSVKRFVDLINEASQRTGRHIGYSLDDTMFYKDEVDQAPAANVHPTAKF